MCDACDGMVIGFCDETPSFMSHTGSTSAVAEETLGSIRTISSLNAEYRALKKYNNCVDVVEKENLEETKVFAVMLGLFCCCDWPMYATGLWYGGSEVWRGEVSPPQVFRTFMAILMGIRSIGQISPNLTAVQQAKGAAVALYQLLDTPSKIDPSRADQGIIPRSCEGRIDMCNVDFAYPNRLNVLVLKNCSMPIESGQTVAFVGSSGAGKSTIVSLLERFYDPTSGAILLDGRDLKSLHVKWLRSRIGLVSQEPVMFSKLIAVNIIAGQIGFTREDVVAAAKTANAHSFIMELPNKYDTLVGEKGVSLSGGQKQRIAIARAIIRSPTILLLDEATSALDTENERVVQDALDQLTCKTTMTTMIIAHRLSTIRNAEHIYVFGDGGIVEDGTHDSLINIEQGVYRRLYLVQDSKQPGSPCDIESVPPFSIVSAESSDVKAEKIESADKAKQPLQDVSTSVFTMKQANELSKPERGQFFMGMFGSAINGASFPVSSVLLSQLIGVMIIHYANFQRYNDLTYLSGLAHEVTTYVYLYFAGSVIMMTGRAIQSYEFQYVAEKLTSRLRYIHFSSLCRQNIAFFDNKEHSTGALTAALATYALRVSMVSGEAQARVFQACFTAVVALLISFLWGSVQLTLVMLVVAPLLIVGNTFRSRSSRGSGILPDDLARVGAHASEMLCNIRTVASLGFEKSACMEFDVFLDEPLRSGEHNAHINGLAVGFSSFVVYATYALAFWYGGMLVDDGSITFLQMMRSLMAIIMSARSVGASVGYVADADSAFEAGAAILSLRDRHPLIDTFSGDGVCLHSFQGNIEFKNVAFRYPTRPNVKLEKQLDYVDQVEEGKVRVLHYSKDFTTRMKDKYYWTEWILGTSISGGFDNRLGSLVKNLYYLLELLLKTSHMD
ncbi:Multidrug resistance protein ABC transporter [Phytophthora megakarya]|uniref:Multidrug resistance protein ABC transporter n=1 Tax=Phytophthora megakarya TaxID=4795 RepID=A0A225VP92_9STRA|nr:Multidrug resistance protein ABC transporter [Phytophthora megakarya]